MDSRYEEFNINNGPVEKPIEVYIKGIGGLRTLGIFGVVLYHMFPYTIKGGFLGVTLFFILAGYLLAVKTEESRRVKSFKVPDFYLKRIKRLYPQLIIVLFMTCGLFRLVMPKVLSGIRPELASILFGYNNIWQIIQNASYFERIANSSPFTHMWSLSNELQLYLIWPLIFFLYTFCMRRMDTKKAITVIGVIALISAVFMPLMYNPEVDVTRIYYGTDTRMFSFLTGAYIGFRRAGYKRYYRIKNAKNYCVLFGVLTAAVVVSYIFMDGQAAFTYLGGMFLINLIMGWMLMLVTDRRLPIGDYLEKKGFAFFGNISYEMYLWMYPVIYVFNVTRINRLPLAPVLMFVIIVALAKWLNSFSVLLVKRKVNMEGDYRKKALQAGFLVVSFAFVLLAASGGYSAATAPAKDNGDLVAMQAELEEHARQQQEENASGTETKVEEETSVSDSTESDSDEEVINDSKTQSQSETVSESDSEEDEEETNVSEPVEIDPSERTVTAVGDSVMLGARPALLEAIEGSVVDAAESRQLVKALDILKSLDSQGKLGNTVIIALGTNGPFKKSKGQEIIDYLGPDRLIYWVNVYGDTITWADESNGTIAEIVNDNANVKLIDWNSEAPKHSEWFYNDGIHLKPEGQKGYAQFVSGIVMQ